MPIWLEVFVAWMVIGTGLNILAYSVLRKHNYFRWLNGVHDTIAYKTGYKDAKKEIATYVPTPSPIPQNIFVPHLRQLRDHGGNDNRYNLTKEC